MFLCLFFPAMLLAGDTAVAPDIMAKDLQGDLVESKVFLKKGPAIVWFWNACCGLKKQQLRVLKNLHAAYAAQGLTILAVNEDEVKKAPKAREAISIYKIPFIVIMDAKADVYRQFHAYAVPSVYLIAQDGKICYSKAGFIKGDGKRLENEVAKVCKKKSD
jgi:peroxiredoxin